MPLPPPKNVVMGAAVDGREAQPVLWWAVWGLDSLAVVRGTTSPLTGQGGLSAVDAERSVRDRAGYP